MTGRSAARRVRRAAVGLATVLVGLVAVAVALAGPASATVGRTRPPATAERVLIVSLPMVSWADLAAVHLPHLERFFRGAAVAGLSTRVDQRLTPLADGYATLGAGTRAVGVPSTDGDGRMAWESFGAATAAQALVQRTGADLAGQIVDPGVVAIDAANAALHYDARVGALGAALERAGYAIGVIGNADGNQPDPGSTVADPSPPPEQRQVVLGLMDSTGQVAGGRVDAGLLAVDPSAPFGVRLDPVAVGATFTRLWQPRSVVLVEASDLVRAARAAGSSTPLARHRALRSALRRTDRLLGVMLDQVDARRDLVMIAGPAHRPGYVTLTPLAIRGPGFGPGWLRSPGTRRDGFVQIQDLAPTVLAAVGEARPPSMEGRPATVTPSGASVGSRLATIRHLDVVAQFRDQRIGETYGVLLGAVVVTMVVGAVALRRRSHRARLVARCSASWSVGLLASAFLVRLTGLETHGVVAFDAAWLAIGAACAAVALAIGARGRRRGDGSFDGLLAVCATVVVVLTVDAWRGAPLVLDSVLGYSPTVAGRFAGFGNPAYAAYSAAALVVAVLVHQRLGGRRGLVAAAAVLGLAVVVDVAPMWGSDVGGILSMVPAYAVVLLMLAGVRIRVRTVAVAAGAMLVVLTAAVAVDVARPAADRTHLGRLAVDLANGRTHELSSVVVRKLGENLATIGGSILTWAVLAAIGGAVVLRLRWPDRIAAVRRAVPGSWAFDVGCWVLAVLGFAGNDSGTTVPGIMAVVYVAAWVHLLVDAGSAGAGEVATAGATPDATSADLVGSTVAAPRSVSA
ncbi:MAG: hypothetical protein WCI50_11035 [Actinomycetes bacterium]